MVDAYLLVCTIVIGILLLIANIYIMATYIHPDDRGFAENWFPRIMIVLGLTLSIGLLLIVPLDIANARGFGGGFNMYAIWEILAIIAFVFVSMMFPFILFFYTTAENKTYRQRIITAAIYTALAWGVFAGLFFWTQSFLNTTSIPVTVQMLEYSDVLAGTDYTVPLTVPNNDVKSSSIKLIFTVSFPIYVIAVFSFIGWFFFFAFAGVGLFAIPLDYIHAYRNRPMKRPRVELEKKKIEMSNKVQELINMGQDIENAEIELKEAKGLLGKQKAQSKVYQAINKFKGAVLSVEDEFFIFNQEMNINQVNPLDWKIKLYYGIIFFLISIAWWVQILLNIILQTSGGFPEGYFMNSLLLWIDEVLGLGFLSAFILVSFSGYLLIATVKGNVKFGQQFPIFFTIHPMKPGETMMNSFVFNIGIVLIAVFGLVQLITMAFSEYTRLTAVQMIFGVQLMYMDFYTNFYAGKWAPMAFLVWSGLTMFCNCVFGKQRPFELKQIQKLKGLADKVSFGLVPS